jgi:hypothetical protein
MASSLRLVVSGPVLLLVLLPTLVSGQNSSREEAARVEFFEKKVRPVLVNNCYNCHSANTKALGGLRVDDRNGMLEGGNRGSAVQVGHPEKSLLIQAVRQIDDAPKMPPKKTLTAEEITNLETWIKDGAAWPRVEALGVAGKPNARYEKLRKEHWAWQPLQKVKVPATSDDWATSEIDSFILARLQEKGLKPVQDANKVDLLRRVTFDLTGLPPTPEEIEAIVKDTSSHAFEKVVDRLLASEAYGERWGRHWLDVARYGESTGSARNLPYPHAWRYRDYVIDAFTHDKPYDQFLREQIAGDLLPAASTRERDEHLVATGFLALGVKDVNQRFKVRFVMDNVDEQIDTVSRSVLGLTASCARCHDHKFDPVSTSDYYALAGIFRSTELCSGLRNKMGGGGLDYYDTNLLLPLGPKGTGAADPKLLAKIEAAKKAYEQAQAEFKAIQGTPEGKAVGADGRPKMQIARQKMNKLQADLLSLTDPAANGPIALGVRDAKVISDTEIRIRGEAEKLGPVVPRGFLSVLDVPDAPKVNPQQSGRLELAQWLTSAKNPLTSRVMANRVWHHLFGQGLVTSVDNFGVTGDVPSHPELLDFLANLFVHDGWSVKHLVRTIVLSHAYQLGSDASPHNIAVDPGNRLIWRHSPRRLDAEEIRDAALLAAGRLDRTRPQASPAKDLKVIELPNNGPVAKQIISEGAKSTHRSVYLPLLRGLTPRSLEVFDFAEQGMVTGSRDSTTVPTQALYLLNDPFVRRQSLSLAERLLTPSAAQDTERIQLAYRLTLARQATSREVERATAYLADYEAAERAVVKPQPVSAPHPVQDSDTKPKQAAVPVNPDDVPRIDIPLKEEVVEPADARTAAWASFCQALLGSAEFRYLK